MLRSVFVTLLVLAFTTPALAKQPAHVARKVACNKGWSAYMKANSLQGVEGARQKYQVNCEAGAIDPPIKGKPGKGPKN